jgi:hypothetical protein
VRRKKETVVIASKARKMDKASIAECRRLNVISKRDEKNGSPTKK